MTSPLPELVAMSASYRSSCLAIIVLVYDCIIKSEGNGVMTLFGNSAFDATSFLEYSNHAEGYDLKIEYEYPAHAFKDARVMNFDVLPKHYQEQYGYVGPFMDPPTMPLLQSPLNKYDCMKKDPFNFECLVNPVETLSHEHHPEVLLHWQDLIMKADDDIAQIAWRRLFLVNPSCDKEYHCRRSRKVQVDMNRMWGWRLKADPETPGDCLYEAVSDAADLGPCRTEVREGCAQAWANPQFRELLAVVCKHEGVRQHLHQANC